MAESKPDGAVLETTLNKKGQQTATTTFATPGSADTMYVGPNQAIPVILVPGIMGSPLIATGDNVGIWTSQGKWAWFPDSKVWAVGGYGLLSGLERRRLLDPKKTKALDQPHEADHETLADFLSGKSVPVEDAKQRGWGSVMIKSYGGILYFLENQLRFIFFHGHLYPGSEVARPSDEKRWGELKGYQKLTDDECKKAAAWSFPVYAVGYNWVDTNASAAALLKRRVDEIRNDCRGRLNMKCDKVILVTHSMGGLVARKYAKDNEGDVLGVIHGVQPAIGAATAYARVRSGWESNPSVTRPSEVVPEIVGAWALGSTAEEVMPVFSNGAGPLELLPNRLYGSDWLTAEYSSSQVPSQTVFSLPKSNPYREIYDVPDKWWRLILVGTLVNAKQLNDQAAINASWDDYISKLRKAEDFHEKLGAYYHPNTLGFCGVDSGRKGWGRVTWSLSPQMELATGVWATTPTAQVAREELELTRDNLGGNCALYHRKGGGPAMWMDRWTGKGVGGDLDGPRYNAKLNGQDDPGDSTVPGRSGVAPKSSAKFFATMQGFGHQDAYGDNTVQAVTLYSVIRLAAQATPLA